MKEQASLHPSINRSSESQKYQSRTTTKHTPKLDDKTTNDVACVAIEIEGQRTIFKGVVFPRKPLTFQVTRNNDENEFLGSLFRRCFADAGDGFFVIRSRLRRAANITDHEPAFVHGDGAGKIYMFHVVLCGGVLTILISP